MNSSPARLHIRNFIKLIYKNKTFSELKRFPDTWQHSKHTRRRRTKYNYMQQSIRIKRKEGKGHKQYVSKSSRLDTKRIVYNMPLVLHYTPSQVNRWHFARVNSEICILLAKETRQVMRFPKYHYGWWKRRNTTKFIPLGIGHDIPSCLLKLQLCNYFIKLSLSSFVVVDASWYALYNKICV